jgi:hypothetical protein
MAMIKVPVDETWVGRMAGLADGPWTEEAVMAAFTRYGWTSAFAQASPGERPYLPWCDLGDLVSADRGVDSGWMMYFDEAPPSEGDPDVDPQSGMAMFCAGFWPPLGGDDTGEGHSDNPYDSRNELLAIADEWAVCAAEPEARRADFTAEFDRIHALVRDVFGEPTRTIRGEHGAVHAVWERAAVSLILVMEPCAMNYEADDWIALRLAPAQGGNQVREAVSCCHRGAHGPPVDLHARPRRSSDRRPAHR